VRIGARAVPPTSPLGTCAFAVVDRGYFDVAYVPGAPQHLRKCGLRHKLSRVLVQVENSRMRAQARCEKRIIFEFRRDVNSPNETLGVTASPPCEIG
jgi:hypothetical protein